MPNVKNVKLGNEACNKCGLCYGRKNVVNGKGSLNAKIVFVSEWPGSPEDKTGDIMSGPIADELFIMLRKAGIDRRDVFLTSTVRCIPKAPPPVRIRPPSKDEIDACSEYLDAEINAIKPTIIVPMGTLAVKRIVGKPCTIKNTRGTEIWSEKYNCKIIPIYHPLVIRRKPEYESFTIGDLERIKKSAAYPELTPRKKGIYKIIESIEDFNKLIDRLNSIKVFSYDIETSSLDFMLGKVLSISFSGKEGTGVTVPLTKYIPKKEERIKMMRRAVTKKNPKTGKREKTGEYKETPKPYEVTLDTYAPYWGDKQKHIIDKLRELMKNDSVKVAHNGKFDNKFLLYHYEIQVRKQVDTMLMHHALNENAEGMHDLKECAWNYTDMGGYDDVLEKWFKDRRIAKKKRNYAHLPPKMLYTYAAQDADVTLRLYNIFAPRMAQEKLGNFYNMFYKPVAEVLMKAEMRGIYLDQNYKPIEGSDKILIDVMQDELDQKQADLTKKYGKLNFNSDQQLAKLLFDKLKLPVIQTTEKGARSVSEAVLHEISNKLKRKQHKDFDKLSDEEKDKLEKNVCDEILEYRKVKNMLSKYVIGLHDRCDKNSAIHTTFLVHGTVTGRLSSSNPNLQNIPKISVEPRIKNQFVPRPGYIFIEADYGQAEFRHWANYSQDKDMIRDIIAADNGTGPDIHRTTASRAWGIPIENVTKSQRQNAKTVTFGIMYGRGAESIAEQCGITVNEAQTIIDDFLGRYPTAAAWLRAAVRAVKQYKQIRNVFGRLRRLPGINSPVYFVQVENERLAMNSPIQSAASDMNCMAAVRIVNRIEREKMDGYLLNLVHDSTLFEVREDKFRDFVKIITEEMEKPLPGVTVPMKVELKVGKRWGEMKEFELPKVAA